MMAFKFDVDVKDSREWHAQYTFAKPLTHTRSHLWPPTNKWIRPQRSFNCSVQYRFTNDDILNTCDTVRGGEDQVQHNSGGTHVLLHTLCRRHVAAPWVYLSKDETKENGCNTRSKRKEAKRGEIHNRNRHVHRCSV